ncbi:MAG: DNA mismatch repair endonuclease MutL [Methanomicrobiales archaeon]|nr:DNA mismatch repair endonuclease MutL [Methanomicrobiales archaeon]NYT20212.1 DNA mismatch repair endonuclease MutL [Methanomicrobiales archaeon]
MKDESRCRIRQLDEATIGRIAAGEVVERPASVVKELCENALDAGASVIDIRISSSEGRITGITVTDDGCGMNPEEARLAFFRHATSKIREIDDLPACTTLGFRGEALASIAAVSRVTLTTREKGTAVISGTRLVNTGGTMSGAEEAGCPAGTSITVEDLFYNTPARRKFQRSRAAEIARITGTVERLVITHPAIAFRLTVDGRERLAVPGGGSLYDAIIHLFGLDLAEGLVQVSADGEHVGVRGYLSVPDISRTNPYQIYLSVNSRPISSRLLISAVRDAYGTLLPGDRYPVAFLDFLIPGTDIDVNVHPAKREVRFSHEHDVLAEITALLKEALSSRVLIPGKDAGAAAQVAAGDTLTPVRYRPPDSGTTGVREPPVREQLLTGRQLRLTGSRLPLHGLQEHEPGRIPELRVIGQLGNLYILCSTPDDNLLLIDQHAAHERILYEQIGSWPAFRDCAQELIEPVVIRLSPREADLFSVALPLLKQEGFLIEPFGPQAWAIRTVPVTLGKTADPDTVREIVAELIAPGFPRGSDAAEHLRKIVACRGAVKAGAVLSPEQCDQLIRQLRTTENPYTCPHGRPTMVVFARKKLDELFRRT